MITTEEYDILVNTLDTIKYLNILTLVSNDLYNQNYILNLKIYDKIINEINKAFRELSTNYRKIILKYISKENYENLRNQHKNIYTIDFLIDFIKALPEK